MYYIPDFPQNSLTPKLQIETQYRRLRANVYMQLCGTDFRRHARRNRTVLSRTVECFLFTSGLAKSSVSMGLLDLENQGKVRLSEYLMLDSREVACMLSSRKFHLFISTLC